MNVVLTGVLGGWVHSVRAVAFATVAAVSLL
jgi:hypothetical protein